MEMDIVCISVLVYVHNENSTPGSTLINAQNIRSFFSLRSVFLFENEHFLRFMGEMFRIFLHLICFVSLRFFSILFGWKFLK